MAIAVIALLMAILAPSLNKARKRAKAVACQSKLKQWGYIFLMYAGDYDGSMPAVSEKWADALESHYADSNIKALSCCPMATKPVSQGGQHPFAAFDTVFVSFSREPINAGSYGINGWVCNPPSEEKINAFGLPTTNNWRSVNVNGASNVPLLLDSMWIDTYPDTTNVAPQSDGDFYGIEPEEVENKDKQMRFFCMNRHDGFINGVFLDCSVKKIGLKELWKLKWHRKSDINAAVPQWPDWMKNFKDY